MTRRLLFLAHRCPYPPNKGEKIRGWNLLKHLAQRWTIDLGFLLDDPADAAHLDTLRGVCAHVEAHPVGGYGRYLRALAHLRPGQPLTLGYFHAPGLAAWVNQGLADRRWDVAYLFSSAMAPYVMGPRGAAGLRRRVCDIQDIDSEKFLAYAETAAPPMRQVYRREGRTLLALERQVAQACDYNIFVTEAEAKRFAELAPESAGKIGWIDNGVDLDLYDPALPLPSPYATPAPKLVFTGTMSYRPNIDAVIWFATAVLPLLRQRDPAPEFWIVGANPTPAVSALAAQPGVHVTGRVPDVRPFLRHADVAVAPLLLARGIQNKVLEAMAMGLPVVASPGAHEGVRAEAGRDLLVAEGAPAMAAAIDAVLDGRHPGLGPAARQAILNTYGWQATLARLDPMLEPTGPGGQDAGPQAPARHGEGNPA
jgi:sugar transferase (PEP-CTERM/EpsH1 system associated)